MRVLASSRDVCRLVSRWCLATALCFGLAACDDDPTGLAGEEACRNGTPRRIAVGETLVGIPGEGRFCIENAEAGTYLLVPFVSGPRDTLTKATIRVYGSGFGTPPQTADLVSANALAGALSSVGSEGGGHLDVVRLLEGQADAHRVLGERMDAEVRRLLMPGLDPVGSPRPSAVRTARATREPSEGEVMLLNVAASCDEADRDLRAGRVVAVTDDVVAVVDPDNPESEAFTEADLSRYAEGLQGALPTLRGAFGDVTDLDGNGRVILFFTRAVNEIVPPGSGAGLAIGFFYRGDMFPREGIEGRTAPCAGSNEAEVLYLAVPDPTGEVRGVPVRGATLDQVMLGTIGHEYQHLVNTSRRLHVTAAPVLEETWLNEGLSHIAEELMFYASSGLSPERNLGPDDVTASAERTEAFTSFMYNNLGRLDAYLQSPHDRSFMGRDGSATRGAAWSLLRYAADREPGSDEVFFRALVDGPLAGLDNLEAALGTDPLPWVEDWSVGLFVDDFLAAPALRHRQPSWDYRSLIAALRLIDRRYPLRVLPLGPVEGFSVRMANGSAAYPVFTVAAGTRALAIVDAPELGSGRELHSTLMRVR